ncbi:hypothetical protein LCGC14_1747120 [marine sediment metagenome]|uniref:Uncharacterized protein n=1 Tax=marine sediment metagenome TaxID=412755 RepID=A0A0F9HSB7_9ZZZZ
MKTLIVLFVVFAYCVSAGAGQKYNPFEDRYETVPDNWEVKYNPYEGDFSYQPEDAEATYNPYEGNWDWDSGHNPNERCPNENHSKSSIEGII